MLCDDPVLYIDDRWLYEKEEILPPIKQIVLKDVKPKYLRKGDDLTIVGAGFSAHLGMEAAKKVFEKDRVSCEVIDLRVINPFDSDLINRSVKKTGNLLVIDGGWKTCGLSSEVLASIYEKVEIKSLKKNARRITLKNTPAPTASNLEKLYYPDLDLILENIRNIII